MEEWEAIDFWERRRELSSALHATVIRVLKGERAMPKALIETWRAVEVAKKYGIRVDGGRLLRLWEEFDRKEPPEKGRVFNKINDLIIRALEEFDGKYYHEGGNP